MRVNCLQSKFPPLTIIYKYFFFSMDDVLTDDTLCFFTRSSSDTEIVGVSIRYFKSYAN